MSAFHPIRDIKLVRLLCRKQTVIQAGNSPRGLMRGRLAPLQS